MSKIGLAPTNSAPEGRIRILDRVETWISRVIQRPLRWPFFFAAVFPLPAMEELPEQERFLAITRSSF